MKPEIHSSERGQALVLIVITMVALLGFTALAIDGGMVYSDRRHAQNGADASSLAGGGAAALYLDQHFVTYENWSCTSANVLAAQNDSVYGAKAKAIQRAANNGYTIDQEVSDDNGVETTCGVIDHGGWVDKYIDIHTMITADTQTAFAHMFFKGQLRNTVDAVTRIRPRSPLAFGNAIVALREDCPNTNTGGVHFDGTSDLIVTGGGIFSNACMRAGGSVDVSVSGGDIYCTGSDCYTDSGHPSISPAPNEGTDPLPPSSYEVEPPNCNSVPDRGSQTGGGSIQPGRYSKIRLTNSNDMLDMAPGLYCLSGSFTANGGTITGSGVTIYITSGDFDVAGGVQINLTAPKINNCTNCPPAIPGMLIYLAEGNTGEVSLLGTSDSEYMGTVFAPNGMIEAGGTGSELSEIHAQLIGDTVKMHGTTTVVVNFNGEENNQVLPKLELYK